MSVLEGVSAPGGLSAPGGVCLGLGVSALVWGVSALGVYIPACNDAKPPCGQNDRHV